VVIVHLGKRLVFGPASFSCIVKSPIPTEAEMKLDELIDKYEDWFEYEDDHAVQTAVEEFIDDLKELARHG
jgi:hypothetical protein